MSRGKDHTTLQVVLGSTAGIGWITGGIFWLTAIVQFILYLFDKIHVEFHTPLTYALIAAGIYAVSIALVIIVVSLD